MKNFEDLPTQLESAEDYEKVCEDFVLPFFRNQAKIIVEELEQLHELIKKGSVKQEELDRHINVIKQASAFANEENPMYDFFIELIELEDKLVEQGAFDNDT